MIRAMFNLRCAAGHNHYSPNPKAWIGMSCGKPFENPIRSDGLARIRADKCQKPLKAVSASG